MNVPIFNLTRQYQSIEPEINAAIFATLRRGFFTLDQEVRAFEKSFAAWIGSSFAIGVGSGTDALTLALRALKIGEGDEIIVPANSYPSAFGLSMTGARLRLVDVREDGNIDPSAIPAAITKKTKAIIPVHLYGNPADVPKIQQLLQISRNTKRIDIIEDCAQAHGAAIDGKRVGSFGVIGCFSFYPSKNLGAYGDGGMLVTNNKKIADNLKALRMYGETSRYNSTEISSVSRLDELQAAILRVKLKHLSKWNTQRQKIAKKYLREFDGVGDIRVVNSSFKSANHLFVIRTKYRDRLQVYLAKKGIHTAIHYPIPIHITKSFKHLGYKKGTFPISETLSQQVLSLPLFPELKVSEQQAVIQAVKKFFLR